MIEIRGIGALVVFLCCGFAGITVAHGYVQRLRNLKNLVSAFQLLETEIHFAKTSLPSAMDSIAKQVPESVSSFFLRVGENLRTPEGYTAQEAWELALPELASIGLGKDDIQMIATLGNALGRSDAEDQRKHLVILQKQLERAIDQAQSDQEKNVRLWNYLGFCVGALVVILLF